MANGDKSLPKEHYAVFCEVSGARLDEFRSLELFRSGKRRHIKCDRDKGHKKELELTVNAMREGQASPISFAELVEVTAASFAVLQSLSLGMPVSLPNRRASLASKDDVKDDVTEETIASRED